MGAFFTNVQVHCADVATIEAALTESMLAEGFEIAEDAESATQSIAIAVHGDWIAVYHQATDELEASVDAFGELLSDAASDFAVSVVVHDSDVVMLGLYRNGEALDDFVGGEPGFFDGAGFGDPEGDEAEDEDDATGDPDRWRPLIVDGATTEQLRAVWAGDQMLAEDIVSETAALVGWNEEAAVLGFHSLIDVELELRWLRFCRDEVVSEPVPVDGPPAFFYEPMTPPEAPAGLDHPFVRGFQLLSRGGPGKGVQITAWGSLLTDEIAAPDTLEVRCGAYNKTIAFERATREDGTPMYQATDPDAPIPQCTDPNGFELEESVMAAVRGRYLRLGTGELVLRGAPLENPDGYTQVPHKIAVVEDVMAYMKKNF